MSFLSLFLPILLYLDKPNANLAVEITNSKNDAGKIYIALYNSSTSYMQEDKALSKKILSISNKKASANFENLTTGYYAFVFFRDENGNGKIDKNMLGIPTESYGFSNNVKGTFGAPSFEKAKFYVSSAGGKVSAKLN